jgi:hypothetical protein
MARKIRLLVILVLIFSAIPLVAGNSEKEDAAVKAAENWLAIVDSEKYAESWKETAEYFKNKVKQEFWEQRIQGVRKPLGRLISRKVKTTTYTTTMMGAPDGEYVVIKFETSFENKKTAIETITPMVDKDGRWRVSGYFIR